MHQTYLYVHESDEVYMMVQLAHEEHPFSAFKNRQFHFIGYMAAHGEVSPLYCDGLSEVERPWLRKLNVLGVLCIPDNVGIIHDYPLFAELLSQLSEASIPFTPAQFPHGFPPPVLEDNAFSYGQQLSVITDEPSSMLELPLSAGPTVTGDTHSVSQPPHSAPFNDVINPFDSLLLSTPNSPSTSAAHAFTFGYSTLWPTSSTVFSDSITVFEASEGLYEAVPGNPTPTGDHVRLHPELQWRDSTNLWGEHSGSQRTQISRLLGKSPCWFRVLTLTKALLDGSLWVGLYGNPFKLSAVDHRRAITSNFLTALRLEGKTYDEIRDQPIIINEGGKDITIGWQILRTHLLAWFEHTRSEYRKVIKGAMTFFTNFCEDTESGRAEAITHFLKLLNSEHCHDVQAAISELVGEQLFAELLWTSLLMPMEGLADGKRSGRVADFFPEDICTSTKCLAEDTVCNLVTLIYQTMLLVLKRLVGKDRKKELAVYLDHKVMSDVITAALCPMYEKPYLFPEFTQTVTRLPFIQYQNVLNFEPKTKAPRMIGKTKVARTLHDVRPIDTTEPFEAGSLPNNAGFQSYRSLVDVFCSINDFRPVMQTS
ncbi:uncharacterized protein F5891DRAFT_984619 [Suillus fuscotomentosus]|uniref:Uncharacterized protein n=1 Tax=Suillus fuscotomentosus TaxID=1912939 RepID=A0AAD4HEQ7_9AGAM|nr:uncharacterized protein F5891DRAFT_984619 [Suillus fuscotomentosus]KAG1894900.1 hypothetical protein F5891DRAFT_984619 [Suillus fuscotomentosus]